MACTMKLTSRIGTALLAATAFVLISPMAQAGGDAAKGEKVFMHCTICHTAEKDGGNKLGPNLFGVAGRKSASLSNFSYSAALKNSGIVWTDDKLKAWVSSPANLVPGTRMTFAGLSDPGQTDDVIAYLRSKK